jgi:hypothetical protein
MKVMVLGRFHISWFGEESMMASEQVWYQSRLNVSFQVTRPINTAVPHKQGTLLVVSLK